MKKILLFALVQLLVLAAALPAGAQTTLDMWMSWEGPRLDAWQNAVDRFNETHDDVQINLILNSTYPEPLSVAFAGGAAPDLIVGSYAWVASYARQGMALNLKPFIDRSGGQNPLDDIFPGVRPGHDWQDGVWGIPYTIEMAGIYGNARVLQEAGVSKPQSGWMWDDLLEQTQKITRLDSNGEPVRRGALSRAGDGITHIRPFLLQAGARFFTPDGRRGAINSPEAATALEFSRNFQRVNHMTITGSDAMDAFTSGNAGFFFDGIQRTVVYHEGLGDDLFITPLPIGPKGEEATYTGALNLTGIRSGDSQREEATFEAIQWLTSPESMARYNIYIGGVPARLSALEQPEFQDIRRKDSLTNAWITNVAPYATFEGWAGIPAFQEVNSVVSPAIGRFFKEDPPITGFLEELNREIDATLKEFWNNQ